MEPITLCLRESPKGWSVFQEDQTLFACTHYAEALATACVVAAAQAEFREAVTHIELQCMGEAAVHVSTFAPQTAPTNAGGATA